MSEIYDSIDGLRLANLTQIANTYEGKKVATYNTIGDNHIAHIAVNGYWYVSIPLRLGVINY